MDKNSTFLAVDIAIDIIEMQKTIHRLEREVDDLSYYKERFFEDQKRQIDHNMSITATILDYCLSNAEESGLLIPISQQQEQE